MDEERPPEARPDQLAVSVEWQAEDGGLRGSIDVRNVSDETVRVSNKPRLLPLDDSGDPLDVGTVVTLEMRLPGYVVLEPGQRARADARWAAWTGGPPGDRVLVRWPGGEQLVTVSGPTVPQRTDGATGISPTWFRPLPDPS